MNAAPSRQQTDILFSDDPGEPPTADPGHRTWFNQPFRYAMAPAAVGLAVVIAVIAAGWIIYSQLRTISMPSAVAVKPLAVMPRLAGQGTPMPELRRAAAALAPVPIRPTSAEQEAEKQEKARAALAAQQMVMETAKRKEKAWAAYYVAPASCEHPPAWKDQVDCGNQYIRAKREFEQQWQAHIGTQ